MFGSFALFVLARLRQPPAAILINRAITRGASGTKTFPWTYSSYMQSFIKIRGAVLEKNDNKTKILYNFNKDNGYTIRMIFTTVNVQGK